MASLNNFQERFQLSILKNIHLEILGNHLLLLVSKYLHLFSST